MQKTKEDYIMVYGRMISAGSEELLPNVEFTESMMTYLINFTKPGWRESLKRILYTGCHNNSLNSNINDVSYLHEQFGPKARGIIVLISHLANNTYPSLQLEDCHSIIIYDSSDSDGGSYKHLLIRNDISVRTGHYITFNLADMK